MLGIIGMATSTEIDKEWELVLYTAGETPKMNDALSNLRKICEEHLEGRYHIKVVDLRKHPEMAANKDISVTPTLVRRLPPPLKKIIGDLSDKEKVLVGLEVRPIK
jgi:circadian clock protein KaiB